MIHNMSPATKPTIVLVHGAWHSVDCFDLLRGELHKGGWPTEAPAHPSPGANSSTTVGTAENAAAIRKVLQRLCDEGKEIVVVAHSYGGATSSCAVEGLGSKQRAAAGQHGGVLLLVYLTAFVIPKGVSILEASGGTLPPWQKLQASRRHSPSPRVIKKLTLSARGASYMLSHRKTCFTMTCHRRWERSSSGY